jgi:type IV pilus assembly protein PilN
VIRINLIKEEGKDRAKFKLYLLLSGMSILGVISLVVFLVFSYGSALSELSAQEDDLNKRKALLEKDTSAVANLEKQRDELKKRLQIIAQLKKSKKGPVQVLDSINLAIPDKSWLSEISESSDGGMKISGYALENDLVSMFVEDLGQSDFFPKVTIVEITQEDFKDIKVSKFLIEAAVSFEGAGKPKSTGKDVTVKELKDKNG